MRTRKIISRVMILCASVLIILSFRADLFWNEYSTQFYNLSEAGLIYGVLLLSLGIVLNLLKKLSALQFLWLLWIGLMSIQLIRIHPSVIFVSHIMVSAKMFWGTLMLGFVLTVISLWRKFQSIL